MEKIDKPKYDISRIIGTGRQNEQGLTRPARAVPRSKNRSIVKVPPGEQTIKFSCQALGHSGDTEHIDHDLDHHQ